MPVKLNSTGGGSVTVAAPNTASDYTATFPAATGTVAFSDSQTFTGTTTTGAQSVGGNITFSAADAGIIFNKTGALTNTKLNDYEEGTWTPAIIGLTTAGSCTYSAQVGTYTKVGTVVVATFDLQTTSTASGTGFAAISGLPFATTNQNQACLGLGTCYWANLGASYYNITGYGDAANNRIVIMGQTSASSGIQYVAPGVFLNGSRIFGVCYYRAQP